MYLKATISYDGSSFCGLISQDDTLHHKISIFTYIQNKLKSLGVSHPNLIASGRTDSGVHATYQVIRFCVDRDIDIDEFKDKLNAKLSPKVRIKTLKQCDINFHPRFDAKSRAYRYLLATELPNVFCSDYVSVAKLGDIAKICEILPYIVGVHNFSLFKKLGSPTKSDIREVQEISFYKYKNIYVFKIKANGFLRSQIRLLIGAILAYSNDKISKNEFLDQLDSKHKYYATPLSPNGLYLCGVWY